MKIELSFIFFLLFLMLSVFQPAFAANDSLSVAIIGKIEIPELNKNVINADAENGIVLERDIKIDSRNDVFHPVIKEDVEEYQLKIFNRSGLLIFESNDINIGWDGYYLQKLMPQGVYVWKVRGRFAKGRSFVEMGDVTLLWLR